MGERPGIAERVLHGRDDADHTHGLRGCRSLGVAELNQTPKRALSWPETLGEQVIDDRDRLRTGREFDETEIPAAKHGKSEDSSVVAADGVEHCADRSRARIGGACRSDITTVPDCRKRKQ
jgi:hypothetical protein